MTRCMAGAGPVGCRHETVLAVCQETKPFSRKLRFLREEGLKSPGLRKRAGV